VLCIGISAVTPVVFVDAVSILRTAASELSSVVEVVAVADTARVMGGMVGTSV
jgi:hypothetical protein